jgi:arylsulfatase A-like enzyme
LLALLVVLELLLVVGLFAWRVFEAHGLSRAALGRTALFAISFVAILGVAFTPRLSETIFGASPAGEVRLQWASEAMLILLAIAGWGLSPRRSLNLSILAVTVALATNVEPCFVFLFVASSPTCQREFFVGGRSVRRRDWLALGMASALVASLLESSIRGLLQVSLGAMPTNLLTSMPALQPDEFWLLLLANLALFLSIAGLLGLIARRWPAAVSWPSAAFTLAYVSVAAPALMLLRDTSYPIAKLVLLLGIGQVATPALARWWLIFLPRVWRVVPLALPAAACLVLVAVGWVAAHASSVRASRIPRTSPMVSVKRPNVLLITLDTVRAQSLSLYGHDRQTTPELERWGARGVVFDRAIAPSSWTLPTHASLFTGRLPSTHGADFLAPLAGELPVLAESFAAAGYETVGFVANHASCGAHTGLERGFERYEERPPWSKAFWRSGVMGESSFGRSRPFLRATAAEVNQRVERWLDGRDERPFFGFINYFDAHEPYEVPDARFDQFSQSSPDELRVMRERWQRDGLVRAWDPTLQPASQMRMALDTYEAAIAYLDNHLGRLLATLDERGLLDNTVVLITSDHGEHFGEHGLRSHAVSLYQPLVHVPLIVIYPRLVPREARIDHTVGLIDVPATLLDLAGVPRHGVAGKSLERFWRAPGGVPASEDGAIAELSQITTEAGLPNSDGPIRSLVFGQWHYLQYPGRDKEELFDLTTDAGEMHNLAGMPELDDTLAALRARVDEAIASDSGVSMVSVGSPRRPPQANDLARWLLRATGRCPCGCLLPNARGFSGWHTSAESSSDALLVVGRRRQ